jgi:hypothetical protein
VKSNAIDVLRGELRRTRRRGAIGTGSMNAPCMPVEERLRLAEGALRGSPDNARAIVERAKECGVNAIVASFGVTLRDRQRARHEARYGNALRVPLEALCALPEAGRRRA